MHGAHKLRDVSGACASRDRTLARSLARSSPFTVSNRNPLKDISRAARQLERAVRLFPPSGLLGVFKRNIRK